MSADPAAGVVFEGDRIVLGEFHCWPGDPRWSRENCAEEGHFVVFPGTSVVIEHEGKPVVATPNHVMFYNPQQSYRRRTAPRQSGTSGPGAPPRLRRTHRPPRS